MSELANIWKVDLAGTVSLRRVINYLVDMRKQKPIFASAVLSQLQDAASSPFGVMAKDKSSRAKVSIVGDWILQHETRWLWHEFLTKEVGSYTIVEQHGLVSKYRLPRARPLAAMFRMVQDNFEYLRIEEYSLCQTTLEQVFNAFARQQVQNEVCGDLDNNQEEKKPNAAIDEVKGGTVRMRSSGSSVQHEPSEFEPIMYYSSFLITFLNLMCR